MNFKFVTKTFVALLTFFIVLSINNSYAQENSSPKITVSGEANVLLETSFTDSDVSKSGGFEGFNGDYRKGFPQFILDSAELSIDAEITPWLSATIGLNANNNQDNFSVNIDEVSFKAMINPTMSLKAGFFEVGERKIDITGISFNGMAMENMLDYKIFLANAYTSIPTNEDHFAPAAPRIGFAVSYDVFRTWEESKVEYFKNDTNLSFSLDAEYANKRISQVDNLANEKLAEKGEKTSSTDTILTAVAAPNANLRRTKTQIANTTINPAVKSNYMAAKLGINARFSMITVEIETEYSQAKAVDLKGDAYKIGSDETNYAPEMSLNADITAALYNEGGLKVASTIGFKYFNQAYISGDSTATDTNANMLDHKTLAQEHIMRLSVAFPMYIGDYLKITPEFITDLQRNKLLDGKSTDSKNEKNMVFRIGHKITF